MEQGGLISNNGNAYFGTHRNSFQNGEWLIFFNFNSLNCRSYYLGGWEYGLIVGQGKLVSFEGEIFEGQFQEGKKNGVGKLIFVNKETYEGTWKNDLMNGHFKILSKGSLLKETEYINSVEQ